MKKLWVALGLALGAPIGAASISGLGTLTLAFFCLAVAFVLIIWSLAERDGERQ